MDFQALVKFILICFDSLAWPLFALGYPLRASIRAIEVNSITETKKLVTYWIIFSLISLFEHAFTGILRWLPFWPYMKLTIVCWTMIPHFNGALYVYNHFVHPCVYMDLPTIIKWFKKQQDFSLKVNFLAEAADENVKAHGTPEPLEKLIANEPKGTEPSILQKDIKPVHVTEKREVAPAKPITETDPNAVQTVNNTVTLPEIEGGAGFDLPEIPSDKQVQEWTCGMCQVTTTSEKTLNSHLRGRKHMNACERLMKEKNQPSTVNNTITLPGIEGEAGFDLPEIPSDKQFQKEWTCAMCQVTTTSEETLNSHLQGRKHMNACERLMKAKNQPSKGKVGLAPVVKVKHSEVPYKDPQKHGSSSDNIQGSQKKQKLPKGQVSASSVAPKNSDFPSNNASTCSKPMNPKNETSEINREELKKSFPTTNMAGNQVKSSENVQGQQLGGNEHGETNIPQFRCTICNISCGRSEDLNRHLWGKKHLAQIQKLNSLRKGELA